MATISTVPAVKKALYDALTAGLGGVQVSYGHPSAALVERQVVYVGDVQMDYSVPVMRAGRQPRQEEFTVEVIVNVAPARGEPSEAEAEAFALLAAVEDVVADDPTLGGVDGLLWVRFDSGRVVTDLGPEGPICLIAVEVACAARLN
jgi:hypothetical protein